MILHTQTNGQQFLALFLAIVGTCLTALGERIQDHLFAKKDAGLNGPKTKEPVGQDIFANKEGLQKETHELN